MSRLATAVLVLCATAQSGCSSSDPTSAGERGAESPLRADPPSLRIGLVPQASVTHYYLELLNDGATPIRVTGFTATCECLHVSMLDSTIPAQSRAMARATIDLGHYAHFSGDLAIEACAHSSTDESLCRFSVELSVKQKDRFAKFGVDPPNAAASLPEPVPMGHNEQCHDCDSSS